MITATAVRKILNIIAMSVPYNVSAIQFSSDTKRQCQRSVIVDRAHRKTETDVL